MNRVARMCACWTAEGLGISGVAASRMIRGARPTITVGARHASPEGQRGSNAAPIMGMIIFSTMGNGEEPSPFKATWYFENKVRATHWEANRSDWIRQVLDHAQDRRPDPNVPGRTRIYGYIQEQRKYIRVVWDDAEEAVRNAFFDRNYGRTQRRGGS